jgi:hypothetical protein
VKANAGGGDWLDLPTRPVQHRGRALPEGLPWGEITDQYVAAGGQVDAGVWGRTEKVRVIESGGRGSDRVHTFAERSDYQETAAPKPKRAPAKRATERRVKRTLTDEQRAEIARRYVAGESMNTLSAAFGVGIGSISWAMKVHGVKSRTPVAAAALRFGKAK